MSVFFLGTARKVGFSVKAIALKTTQNFSLTLCGVYNLLLTNYFTVS